MNVMVADIKRLLDKKEVRALTEEKEGVWRRGLDHVFANESTAETPAAFDDTVARLVLLVEPFLKSFPEGTLILELAEKHMTHVPMFPDETMEEKMVLIPYPTHLTRDVVREILAKVNITKSNAAKLFEILGTVKSNNTL